MLPLKIVIMSFNIVESTWNSVDVRGNDGLLHSGRVIDAVDGGLVVHFGGIGHSGPRLVPFGDVYIRPYSTCLSDLRREGLVMPAVEREVEVLLRVQPEDPWKWYPGLLLDGFGLVARVRVVLPDRELNGVVVEQRIRERSTEASLAHVRVKDGQFSRKLIVLPSPLPAFLASEDQLITAFNTYSRHCRHYNIMATKVLSNPHHGVFKELAVLERRDEGCWSLYGVWECASQEPPDKILVSVLESGAGIFKSVRSLSPTVLGGEGDIQSLYRDPTIFPLIFECLTTLQRTKLRGVCKSWETILKLVCFRRVLTVIPPCRDLDYSVDVYRFAAGLYNCCWTQGTETVILYSGSEWNGRLEITARILHCVAEKVLPTKKLLFAGKWKLFADGSNCFNALWQCFVSLAGVCQQLVLKNVEITVELKDSRRVRGFTVRFSDQQLICPLTVEKFWAYLNNGLRDLDAEDMKRLVKWISSRSLQWKFSNKISRILNITQTQDPRDGVRYRGMTFHPFGDTRLDGVDARHLTKLTQHALLQLYKDRENADLFNNFRAFFRI